MELLDQLLHVWLTTSWYIAGLMAFIVNCAMYLGAAACIQAVSRRLCNKMASPIDASELKPSQIRREIGFGILACAMFALTSLASRALFEHLWPSSLWQFALEMLLFTLFYETYSYFIHRLLHHRWFRAIHGVHHQSRVVTPWSAYSVHPGEALLIGISAPLFMVCYPISLSLVLWFHLAGMLFTMLLHSNVRLDVAGAALFNRYTQAHSAHHQQGHGNFGFVHRFWDQLLHTALPEHTRPRQ